MTQITSSDDASLVDAPPTFDILPLSHEVRKAVDALGYTHPTPVQRAVFESVASGRDVVVQARTGTGKTAAFGLPVVDRIVDVERKKPQVLVLCPTRELALQIHRELELLSKYKGITTTAVYGGAAMQPQIDAIAAGAQIIAGTPGRVLDHLERGTLKTKSITALVLDESDEMLSMGFLPQITKIMEQLPSKHQTLLFSATLPPDVKRIADSRLTDPEFITLSGDHIGALSIEHYVYRSSGRKSEELIQLIEIENPESAIVFCNTRDQTKQLATALQKQGFAADWLNADLAQKDREKVMSATRQGQLRFLVCTDVAARGIDISHLTHVINADFPESTENYVHRTGRTGRAGRTGTAISLITPQDVGNLYMLRLTYKIFPVERDLPRPLELKSRKEADMVQFLFTAFSNARLGATDRSLARRVLASDSAELIVAGLLADHLGAHPSADETATALRKEKQPTPTLDVADPKKKKKKKKKDKSKFERDDVALDDEGSAHQISTVEPSSEATQPTNLVERGATVAERSVHERTTVHERTPLAPRSPAPDRAHVSQVESLSTSSQKVSSKEPSARRREENKPTVSAGVHVQSDELEVISAADLLSAEERALLRGDAYHPPEPRAAVRESRSPQHNDNRSAETRAEQTQPSEGRIFINVGSRDGVTREDFLDTLADVGFPIAEVGEIAVKEASTFLHVPPGLLQEALDCLNGEDVAGVDIVAEVARPKRPFNRSRGPGQGTGGGSRGRPRRPR